MRRPKGRHALALLGVLGALLGTAVVFGAARRGDFSLKVSSPRQSLTAGRSASFPIKVKRLRGFKGAVKLSVSGLPRGASANWKGGSKKRASAAAAATVRGNQTSATLTIVTSAATPAGAFKPTITARGGRREHSKKLQLTVTAAGGGGVTGTGGGPGGGAQSTPNTPAEPTFSLSATPSSRTVPDGDSTSYDIAVDRAGGYTGPVALDVTGEPATGGATFTPGSASGSSSTLTINTNSGTTPGTYDLVITGTGGGKTASAGVALVVVRSQDFAIAGSAPGGLTPGGPAQPLDLRLANPNGFAVVVHSLGVILTGAGAPGCLASWFAVTQYGGPDLVVPAGATDRSLTSLGATQAQLPKVAMTDAATNQDACKGRTLSFGYSGTATK